jgi:18S rRNA (guanine1575-N7)-methyltransferase
MLAIPKGQSRLLLDIGCGSGISGSVLSEKGHMWLGMDISKAMLDVASTREEVEGDLIHSDMGHGFGFRSGTFDGAVSVSALQWLCSAEKKVQNPYKRLNKFFSTLYASLIKGARCAFQFYPSGPEQVEMITSSAMRNGFTGGLIVDYPNSKKAKKYYLFLMAGYSEEIMNEARQVIMPQAKQGDEDSSEESSDEDMSDDDEEQVASDSDAVEEDDDDDEDDKKIDVKGRKKKDYSQKKKSKLFEKKIAVGPQGGVNGIGKKHQSNGRKKDRSWILRKKERQRRQGKEVRVDSKYSGRKRSGRF